ncbi:MAG: MFS transporter [Oscillospiraceae bacterium]|nr:MFS transporter [Oscillospiraceae bacterium]
MKENKKKLVFVLDNIKNLLGLNKMSENFIVFSNVHLGFLMFYTLQLVFMNTLLRRFSDGNDIIYLYNMIFFSFIPVGMMLAAFSIKKKSFILTMRSSLYLWIGILIVTLSLIITKQLDRFCYLLAFVSSLANGCYWIAYYIALTDYTDIYNRDVGLSVIGIYTGLANVIIPLVGGYIIKIFENYTGYIIMFCFAFAVATLSILETRNFKIHKKNIEDEKDTDKEVHMLVAIKYIIKDKIWLYSSLSEFFRGIRDGVFIFLLNVLIFSVSANEALVGINAFIAGVINIISNWVLGKILSNSVKDNKIRLLIISVSVLFSSSFLLLLKLNIFTLITMTCINAFFTIFIQNITQSVFCLSVQINKESKNLRVESFVMKSYFLAFGRFIGILFMLILPETDLFTVLGIIFLTLLQIGTVITAQKTILLIKKSENQESCN